MKYSVKSQLLKFLLFKDLSFLLQEISLVNRKRDNISISVK